MIASRFEQARDLQHTPVFNSWKRPVPISDVERTRSESPYLPPTHLLFDSIAYPLEYSGIYRDSPIHKASFLPESIRQAFRFPWAGKDLQVSPTDGLNISVNNNPANGGLVLKTGDELTVNDEGRDFSLQLIHCSSPE
jgi:hypothetical protein